MRGWSLAAALGVALLAGACSPQAAKTAQAAAPEAAGCRDDGPRLADTGICAISFGGYATPAEGADYPPPPECSWTVNDTLIGDGRTALLYRAVSCKGGTTKLAHRVNAAGDDEFFFATSAMYGAPVAGETVITAFAAPPGAEGQAAALARARAVATDKAEAAACEVRPAQALAPDWPKDAFVIDVTSAFAAKNPKYTEVYAACGPLGIDVGQTTFWRLFQGRAWRFSLGQETPDIDPRSVTLIRKSADGAWAAVE